MPLPSPEPMTRAEAGAYFKKLRTDRKLRLQDVVDGTTVPNVQYLSALEAGRYNVLNSEHFPSLVQFFRLSREEIERIRPGTFIETAQDQDTEVIFFVPEPPQEDEAIDTFKYYLFSMAGIEDPEIISVTYPEVNKILVTGSFEDQIYKVSIFYTPHITPSFRIESKKSSFKPLHGTESRAATSTAASFTPNALGYKIPKQPLPPIPDPLIDAGIIYGDRPGMEGLKEYRWQRWMERMPHRRRPQTPEEWLSLYLDLRDKIDPPEPEE